MRQTKSADAPPPVLEEESLLASLMKQDAFAAGFLLLAALASFLLANSPWQEAISHFWHWRLGLFIEDSRLSQSLLHWINDGLMVIFFFVVGLEIKRELLVGELASFRKALLPGAAALGGMIFPAAIFAAINWGTPAVRGWGIPMATDIAFATGCLGLLGKRVNPALGVFLMALAIVDDLGSVAVIAIFYTAQIAFAPLLAAGVLIAVSYGLNRFGVRHALPYAILGVLLWLAFLQSGVHATIAGVLLAFTIPANARYETPLFFGRMTTLLQRFTNAEDHVNPLLVNGRQQGLIRHMLQECHHVEAPLQRIEHLLHPLCVVFILPVFAFANSGVTVDWSSFADLLFERVTLGVFFGLLVGKQAGVMLASWLTVKLGWADLPQGVQWRQSYGLPWLAGIGFTMALFIGELAFATAPGAPSMAAHLAEAKIGVFLASLTAGVVGCAVLWFVSKAGAATPKRSH